MLERCVSEAEPVSPETIDRVLSRDRRLARLRRSPHSLDSASPALRHVTKVYLLSRGLSTLLLLGVWGVARFRGWSFTGAGHAPDFVTFLGSWDGWYYRSIALHGYPLALPVDASGHVRHNAWAFLPVFPLTERLVNAVTGLPLTLCGVVIAAVAGFGTAFVLLKLLAPVTGEARARWAVTLFCFGPMSFLLEVAYAESFFVLLLLTALLFIRERSYLRALPLATLAAFTRPGAVVLTAVIGLQVLRDVWQRRGWSRGASVGVVSVALSGVAGLAWPVIVGEVTGVRDAYVETELSWWTGWVGRPNFVPFTPWFLMGGAWLGLVGVVLVGALIAAATYWLLARSPTALGFTLRSYNLTYAVYLLAVFLPQVSLPRLLLPLAPLLGTSFFVHNAARYRRWLVVSILLQVSSVVGLWFLSYP